MNRVVKFRGKRVNGEWVYGGICYRIGEHPQIIATIRKEDELGNGYDDYEIYSDLLEDTVGQFTGCYDIDGTPIYEGDIVSVKSSVTATVIWEGRCFHFYGYEEVSGRKPDYVPCPENKMRVIGNIHESLKTK